LSAAAAYQHIAWPEGHGGAAASRRSGGSAAAGRASVGEGSATEKGCPRLGMSVGAGDSTQPGAVVVARVGISLASSGAGAEGARLGKFGGREARVTGKWRVGRVERIRLVRQKRFFGI
jgi:hypothetical protein